MVFGSGITSSWLFIDYYICYQKQGDNDRADAHQRDPEHRPGRVVGRASPRTVRGRLDGGGLLFLICFLRGDGAGGRSGGPGRRAPVEDGVAENFHAEQNRELLEKLSSETGGRYYKPADVSKLSEEISYSEAGITTRETKDLWNMPFIFLLLVALRTAEWLLRRKWGAV